MMHTHGGKATYHVKTGVLGGCGRRHLQKSLHRGATDWLHECFYFLLGPIHGAGPQVNIYKDLVPPRLYYWPSSRL